MKIAICVSGQPRNFKKSYITLKNTFLNKYDCDIYFHSWKSNNFKSTDFGDSGHEYHLEENNYSELIELYKPYKYLFESPIIFDASGLTCPIWRQPLNNTLSMYYSIYKSIQLVSQNYDYIIRTRFDIDYTYFNFNLPKEGIVLPEWNNDIRVKNRGYYDIFAMGNQKDMIKYSEVFCNVISYVTNDQDFMDYLQEGWPGQDSPLRNEYLLKWHLIKNNVKVFEHPTEFLNSSVGIIR